MTRRMAVFLPVVVVSCFCLSRCATTVTVNATASPDDYTNCRRTGSAVIAGEAFAKTKAGDVKPASGYRIHLDPATPYSTAVYRALKQAGDLHSEKEDEAYQWDQMALSCRRSVTADSTGHFRFERVKAGSYYVSCYIRWQTRGSWTGGWQVQAVRVADGQQLEGVVVH